MIERSAKTPYRIAVYGTGWDRAANLPSTWDFFGPVDYMQQFDAFGNSRFTVNLDPNWSHGVHDRVFNAMTMRTAVITNTNTFTNLFFDEGNDHIGYEGITDAMDRLEENFNRSEEIAENASRLCKLHMSWSKRAQTLISLSENQ